MKISKLLTKLIIIMFCTSCSAINPKIYSENSPKFDIRSYFNGKLEAQGIIQDRSGKVIKSFKVKMDGSWQGNNGKLEEDFLFSDGKTDRRIWDLSMQNDHKFTGKAHDVVGEANGEQYGNAVRMDYVLTIPVDGKKYNVKINDWLYLTDEETAINVSKLTKFGFEVGRLTIYFKKL